MTETILTEYTNAVYADRSDRLILRGDAKDRALKLWQEEALPDDVQLSGYRHPAVENAPFVHGRALGRAWFIEPNGHKAEAA